MFYRYFKQATNSWLLNLTREVYNKQKLIVDRYSYHTWDNFSKYVFTHATRALKSVPRSLLDNKIYCDRP